MLKTGVDGSGIASIEKTGTSGLVDTYTITLDDGRKTTFEVTNGEDGNGIASIAKTGTQGLVDTYTITMDDGYTYNFTVTNGRDGGMSTMFYITSDAGSTVTVTTPSGTVITATQVAGSTTEWEAETVEYGVHTITSVYGESSQSTTVDVTEARIYTVHLEHFIATITVTYPSGATCTCVGSQESYTATGSPYTFTVHNSDTYTITATDGTHTQTATVVITTDGQSESVTLTFVPEGDTVIPTDDIQIWLHCADIWNKNYTTISQVLADSTTLSALIANSNAVDYMVRSTTWSTNVCADSSAMSLIGLDDNCADTLLANSTWLNAICNSPYFESVLNIKVPTMTSDTTPSGQVIYVNQNSNYPKRLAFDGNNSTWAIVTNVVSDKSVGYKFTEPVNIRKVYHYSTNTNYKGFDANAILQYSDDGSTWSGSAGIPGATDNTAHNNIIFDNLGKHLYWSALDNRDWSLSTLQFYGRA
jgi:hypothetical protein